MKNQSFMPSLTWIVLRFFPTILLTTRQELAGNNRVREPDLGTEAY